MELKASGLTETEHQKREREAAFREAIISAAIGYIETWRGAAELLVPQDAQIQLSSNGNGAWVDLKVWIDAGDVDHEWGDEVKNPPSTDELVEALRALLNLNNREGIPYDLLKQGMELVARHQGKVKWMEARL